MPTAHAACYLSDTVRRRISQGGFDIEPVCRTGPAVLLLGDIKGSTSIVEQAGQRGPDALERLTGELDRLYADFIEVIYQHGGDVLYIAGDAFLCYWPLTQEHELPNAVQMATQAAAAIQKTLAGRKDGFGHPLEFRIGIGAGELDHAFVGGETDRWELIVSGDTFDQVAAAEKNAQAGRVLISHQAWQYCPAGLQATELTTGWQLEPLTEGVVTAPIQSPLVLVEVSEMLPYLPAAIASRLAERAGPTAEFRNVTVLMADMPNLGLREPASLQLCQTCVRAFQKVMNRFEGTIKVDVDNKGIMLLGLFGLPPIAHEDDAVRAIRAGENLRDMLERQGVSCGIGIASGRTLCTPLGNDRRREYMVRSEVINRAARLMQATESEIACDITTMRGARHRVEFESLPGHLMKGISASVDVHRPVGRRQVVVTKTNTIIGRQTELNSLQAGLAQLVNSRQAAAYLIEGEAGLGKSTLLAGFCALAAVDDVRILRGNSDAVERRQPLHAWRGVFSDLFGVAEGLDRSSLQERIEDRMQRYPELIEFIPLLAPLVGFGIKDNNTTRHMTGEVRSANTQRLLINLLIRAAQHTPTLIVLEDLHWFDSQSRQLLSDFLAANDSADNASMVLITSRPLPHKDVPSGPIQAMRLAPFGLEEVTSQLSRRLAVREVPKELVSMVLERSGGNPFFAEQIVHSLIDEGAVSAQQGQCRVDLSVLVIPATIEAVVLSRLDRLTPNQQAMTKAASVVGRRFTVESLGCVMQRPEFSGEPSQEDLRVLIEVDYIESLSTSGEEYQFRHVITRDATYETLASPMRRGGHQALAQWLSSNDSNPGLLSHHWLQAGQPSLALAAAQSAGDAALRLGGFPEAQLFFRQALELADELSENADVRANLRKGLGTAQYFLGDLEGSTGELEQTVAQLDRQIPSSSAALTFALAGLLRKQLSYRRKTYSASVAPDQKAILDTVVDSYKMLSQLYFLEGESATKLLYLTLRGLAIGERAGASPALACTLINQSFNAGLIGLSGQSQWYRERAIAMANAPDQSSAGPYVHSIAAIGYAQFANWPAALSSNAKAEVLFKELGDHSLAPDIAAVRAGIQMCLGKLSDAETSVQWALVSAQERDNQTFVCWALLDHALLALARGDVAAADQKLGQAQAIEIPSADKGTAADIAATAANVHFASGRFPLARKMAQITCRLLDERPPTSYYTAEFFASSVAVLMQLLTIDPADKDLAQLLVRKMGKLKKLAKTFVNIQPRYLLLKGLLEQRTGRASDRTFRRSRDRAVELSMPLDEARALAEIAKAAVPDSDSALTDAVQLYKSLGRRWDAQQLESTLAGAVATVGL